MDQAFYGIFKHASSLRPVDNEVGPVLLKRQSNFRAINICHAKESFNSKC